MSQASPTKEQFTLRLATFKRGCDKILDDYLNQPCDPHTGPWPTSIYATKGTSSDLSIVLTKMYAKLKGKADESNRTYTFAIVDISTGDVYRPSDSLSGSLNRKTAKVRGNIFDEYNGLRCVYSGGPQAYVDDYKL